MLLLGINNDVIDQLEKYERETLKIEVMIAPDC